MTLLHMDGFDLADTLIRGGYSGLASGFGGSGVTSTRFGTGRCLAPSTGGPIFTRTLGAQLTKAIVGFAVIADNGGDTLDAIRFLGDNNTTVHVTVRWMVSGALALYRGSTQIAITAAGIMPFSVWHYLEASATISDTVGVAKVRVDGVEVLSFTGDTKNAGTLTTIDAVYLGMISAGSAYRIDDFYICDAVGSAPTNDFLGDVRVVTLSPTAAGASTGLTPSTAPNWNCVDEQPYSATDFVSSATVGATDTYACADLPAGVTAVYGVQSIAIAKKNDAGARSLKNVIRVAGAEYSNAAQPLATSDATYRNLQVTNPATSAAWTPTDVNAIEAGIEVA